MFGELRLVRALTDDQIAAMRDPKLAATAKLPHRGCGEGRRFPRRHASRHSRAAEGGRKALSGGRPGGVRHAARYAARRPVGRPGPVRERGYAGLHNQGESPHLGVDLHGSIQLVRDDLDVVDPLEHDRLPNFVDRDPRYRSRSRIRPPPIPLGPFFSVSHKIAATRAALSLRKKFGPFRSRPPGRFRRPLRQAI